MRGRLGVGWGLGVLAVSLTHGIVVSSSKSISTCYKSELIKIKHFNKSFVTSNMAHNDIGDTIELCTMIVGELDGQGGGGR